MKRSDFVLIACIVIVFLPFFVCEPVYDFYKSFNASHGMITAFIKFALLSTTGELIGLRIVTGSYLKKGFGILPRAIVWGVLGVCINAAMIVFSGGVPVFLQYMGMADAPAVFAGDLSWGKLLVAFCVSVFMNSFFGPVFMTFHKITDAHILAGGGTLAGFFRPIRMGEIMSSLNWKVQWDFVFKKTIPLFWFPAHTVTFLLPGDMRTLCAALLGVALGILLAVAARKK